MALYGGARDVSMFRRVNRELMGNIISQEVIYYKYKVGDTATNMYGEASNGRTFADPVMLFSLIEIGGTTSPVSDLGVDFDWPITFRFLKDDLVSKLNPANLGQGFGTFQQNPSVTYGAEIHPEVGDIILYQESYFEIDNTNIKQYFVGKDPDYPYEPNPLNPNLAAFGYNVSVVCETHYVPADRINIVKQRL